MVRKRWFNKKQNKQWTNAKRVYVLPNNPTKLIPLPDLPSSKTKQGKKERSAFYEWLKKNKGIHFASRREGERYLELQILFRAAEIHSLKVQPIYELVINGTKIGRYTPDFEYQEKNSSHLIVEEVKGMWTAEAKLRVKVFKALYPDLKLRIIK